MASSWVVVKNEFPLCLKPRQQDYGIFQKKSSVHVIKIKNIQLESETWIRL